MFLHRSNRSERLVDALARVVQAQLRDPFTPEWVVVQSRGMERWLAMELGKRLSICANFAFPFPRKLIERVHQCVLPEASASQGLREGVLTWAIAARLPRLLGEPSFAPLAGYLAADHDGRLCIQLSRRIAGLFDDYVIYRPDWVLSWEAGGGEGWEPELWRALRDDLGSTHPAARARDLLAALERPQPRLLGLPDRICLFGISSLPPLYVQLLSALSRHLPVHLFVLSPSREYFADLRRREDRALEHPLLSSLGRLGREFQQVLEDVHYVEGDQDLYVDPGGDSVLHALQSNMLTLEAPGSSRPDAALDDSVRLHSCHGAMREVEVLHDQLCELLDSGDVEPRDVVVMTPDIEAYAPVIEAVFGQSGGRPSIPFTISHQRSNAEHAVIDAFFALLEALQGRVEASALLDLLGADPVRRRFGIEAEELETVRRWVTDSGIRWGQDAEHRDSVGQPAIAQNTWRFGLDRLLLGYAMEGEARLVYAGVAPFDDMEGSVTDLLGRLVEFCESFFGARARILDARPLAEWARDLGQLLSAMLHAGPETQHEHQSILEALRELQECAELAGFAQPLSLASLVGELRSVLDQRLPARGFLSHGVTFCQLVPMRSIPFEVVCLIGMNDDSFPDREGRLGFDRLADARARRPGDRNRRDDDRYMFLEAVLSARRRLHLSYVGQSAHDQQELPPSVVVGELLDALVRLVPAATAPPGPIVQHRMHAFSPRYFGAGDDRRLFSYATRFCRGAEALGAERALPAFLGRSPGQDVAPQPQTLELEIDELIAWLSAPIRTFLQWRLGLYLGRDVEALADREPITLDHLDQWQLGSSLLRLALEGVAVEELLPAARGRGVVPLGTVGDVEFARLLPSVGSLATAARAWMGTAEPLPALRIDLEHAGVRVRGSLDGLWPRAHLHADFSRVGRRFELAHWVRHVILGTELQLRPRVPYPKSSVIVARSAQGDGAATVRFAPLDDAGAVLADLLELARRAHARPLPLPHEAARAYASAVFERASAGALDKAHEAFVRTPGGDLQRDPYVAQTFANFAQLCEVEGEFETLTRALFGPMFNARSEI